MAPRKSPPVSFARESYPPGGAGPSPPLYGPDFLTIPSQNFLESKNRVPKTYTYQSAFCKRGHSLSASAPKATEVLRCRELTR